MRSLEDYPFKALTDARTAMAQVLRDYARALTFRLPKTKAPFRFSDVYEEWAGFERHARSGGRGPPVAAVLPDRPVPQDASFTPRILEETWSGGDPTLLRESGRQRFPVGDSTGDGFALVEVSQLEARFLLLFRCGSKNQRRAIHRTLEQAFHENGAMIPDPSRLAVASDGSGRPLVVPRDFLPEPPVPVPQIPDARVGPVRYGRLLRVPRYFDRLARYTLVSGPEPLDTGTSAIENRWMGQAEILAHMQVCAVQRVRGMKADVKLVVDEFEASRGTIPTT